MYLMLSAVLPLLILSLGECASINNTQSRSNSQYISIISVNNGQRWGLWGNVDMCPTGTYATGFKLRVDPNEYWSDDTALNAIAIHCSKPITSPGKVGTYTTISSTVGSWGSWTSSIWCPSGVLKSFQLLVQSYQGVFTDDTAANNIRFTCTNKQELEGIGMSWGSWGSWSSVCPGTGICGIRTNVQPPQGVFWDDTSLNDVIFYCCN